MNTAPVVRAGTAAATTGGANQVLRTGESTRMAIRPRARHRRHSPAQIVAALRQADEMLAQDLPIATVVAQVGVSEATFHRWRTHYGGIKADDAQRLRELERENRDLRHQVADQCLDILMLRQVLSGAMLPPAVRVQLVTALRNRFGVSERRACEVIGASRSSQRRLAEAQPGPPALHGCAGAGADAADVDFTTAFAQLDHGDRARLTQLIGSNVDHLTIGPKTGVPA